MVSIFDGELTDLRLHDNSIGDLYGSDLNRLGITENGSLNLYAYDVTYHETGGHYDRGWIHGVGYGQCAGWTAAFTKGRHQSPA